MQLTVTPDNPLEWLALRTNQVPIPLLHAQIMPVIAKAVLEAADRGVFEAIGETRQSAAQVAATCNLHEKAVGELLGLLTALGYTEFADGQFALTPMARRWVLQQNPESTFGMLRFNNQLMWHWLDHMGTYLETGVGLHYHDTLDARQWDIYQRGMVAATATEAREFGRRAPISKAIAGRTDARMLDIGGSHGQHSAALCKRISGLRSTILDLPDAVAQAAPLLAQLNMGDRIRHQTGNILTDEIGEELFDIVLMSSLAHHFSDAQNRDVARKVARALRPGGIYIVNEFIRPETGAKPELVGSSTDLFYGMTSTAGNYSVAEIQGWFTDAGLKPVKTVGYLTMPGRMQVVAKK
ncbi:MAG: class I SAM-dependent methyltransferase [Bacteroidetes bacterium]|nr:class I SAM-dependent methyltransferase [Fibrella sp.]